MKNPILQLRTLAGNPNDGASSAEICQLESSWQVKLPKDLISVYKNHDGAAALGKLPWRLLSLQETVAANLDLSGDKVLPPEVKLFWGDDEGNFAGIYFAGPLAGSVCFFEHEERDFSPRFKALKNFFLAMIEAAEAGRPWREMGSEYPRAKAEQDVENLLLDQFRLATDGRKRRQLAFDIIALTPTERSAELMPFLDDPDLWVQERAVETLGKRHYQAAIPHLVSVAQRETTRVHNVRIAAILALGRMKSPEGLESLLGLVGTVPKDFHSYIIRGLELHGCAIKLDTGKWTYRLPGASEWRTL